MEEVVIGGLVVVPNDAGGESPNDPPTEVEVAFEVEGCWEPAGTSTDMILAYAPFNLLSYLQKRKRIRS